MTAEKIKAARAIAKRFSEYAMESLAELDKEGSDSYICGTKTSGALRRASLDLTRALAEMRKA